MHNFTSVFGERIITMLDFRESCGFRRDTHLARFIRFDRYCAEQFPEISELTCQLVHAWLDKETKTHHNLKGSASAIRGFGKYLAAVGEQAYILMDKLSPGKAKFAPYIFTDSEISKLFVAIDKMPECSDEPFLTEIAPVLLRLIYTCGP